MTPQFLILWMILSGSLIKRCVNGMCLNSVCQCFGYMMICENGEIPTIVSLEIRELFIKHFHLNNVNRIHPGGVSAIQKLDIQADEGLYIPQRSFEQFPNLTYLGLHGEELNTIHSDAFLGLENLVTLDMSSNRYLEFHYISSALNSENRTVLPNLVSLSTAKVKTSIGTSVQLDENFFRSIVSGRKLKRLDFSDLNIFRFDFVAFEPMCTSVEYVDVRKSVFGNFDYFWEAKACTSLKTIDISESIIPSMRIKVSFETFHFKCQRISFFDYLENIFANNINTENEVDINGYLLDMSPCPLKFQKIHIPGNKMKWINVTVRLHETTVKSISELNLSYNGLQYISPLFLQPSENIEIVDVSNNNLSIMQENYRAEFEVLFWNQTKLLYLNLSHNSLSEIPKNTFLKNTLLKVLDISFNKIKKIGFSFLQLVNLEKLILRHNRIQTIDENDRIGFQSLWEAGNATSNITDANLQRNALQVYLKGNQFTCLCNKMHMKLIEWLHSAPVVVKSEATCQLDKDVINIGDSGPQDTRHFCTIQTVKTVVIISVPLVITVIILSVATAVTLKKRRERKLQMYEVIAQIEMGAFPLPYLAFLSYCSEDMDLVVEKIYPQLGKHLAEMTHSDKQLVCCGDTQFRPGFAVRYEVMRCVEESSVFIAVISKNFCRKTWCNLEIGWAYDQNKPIIMLMTEHVEKKLMDNFLQKIFDRYAHASWIADINGGHIEPDWKIFCKSIIQLAGKARKDERHVENDDPM